MQVRHVTQDWRLPPKTEVTMELVVCSFGSTFNFPGSKVCSSVCRMFANYLHSALNMELSWALSAVTVSCLGERQQAK